MNPNDKTITAEKKKKKPFASKVESWTQVKKHSFPSSNKTRVNALRRKKKRTETMQRRRINLFE